VIRLTLVGSAVFVLFVLFGPAPVDERKLKLDRAWADHHARGAIFHQKQRDSDAAAKNEPTRRRS